MMTTDDDTLLFADEDSMATVADGAPPWVILVVDDDAEVRAMTRLLLADFRFEGRRAELIDAGSAAAGERILRSRRDIALILLDVVMETDDAGLRLVRYVREQLNDRRTSIVLRTGQPGRAPAEEVIVKYEINDYREKTDLTLEKLFTTVVAALRHARVYDELRALNRTLEVQVRERTRDLSDKSRVLETALANMSDGLAMFDRDGRLRVRNRRAAEILGGSGEVPRGSDGELVLDGGRVVEIRSGTTQDGRIVEVYRDVTEARRRERELALARDEAAAESRARTELLAVMGHEVRTPVAGVLGLAQLALGRARQPELVEDLTTICYTAEALLAALNDVLDFAKLDAGAVTFESQPFDLMRTLDGVLRLLGSRGEQKGLQLKADIADDVPRFVRGDAARLRQVLLNLVSNAIKFTERGSVTLRVRCIATRLRFEVVDTGIGIDAGVQHRLFQAYVQAGPGIARRFGGAGLGLAICRKIVEAAGGAIGLESALGHGSTFWFELDLPATAPPDRTHAPLQALTGWTTMRVLLVDDLELNLRIGAGLLEQAGHEVMVASSGTEAVALAKSGAFDLIVLDLHMPDVDGFETARRIRALPGPAATVPIVALTAAVSDDEHVQARAAGMDATLSKPIHLGRLREVLAQDVRRPAAPPLEDALATLQRTMGTEAAASMLRAYFDEMDQAVSQLSGLLDRSPEHAIATVHRLGGGAGTLGLKSLSGALLDLELLWREGRLDAMQQVLDRIPREIEAARRLLGQRESEMRSD
jgi:signal transduction histidine kinase/DNA-binding response OmpR family regulator